jgi:hypothetical protein
MQVATIQLGGVIEMQCKNIMEEEIQAMSMMYLNTLILFNLQPDQTMSRNRVLQINIVILSCLFCITSKAEIRNDSIKSFRIDISVDNKTSNNEIKKIVLKQLINCSGDSLELSDIKSVKCKGIYSIEGLGLSKIYKINLSYRLPNVWHYSLALIVDSYHNGYLVNLDLIELIKLRQDSRNYYFSGRYKNRSRYGVFKIFRFSNNIMYQIFESADAVSNYSFDCESYENGDLKLQNIDLNNDGYLDLKFTGIKNFYCKGFEQYGRDERRPIKKEKISITYYYNSVNQNWQRK